MKELSPVAYFPKWLKANAHRFKNLPVIIKKDKKCIELKYMGITANLRVYMKANGIVVAAIYGDDEDWFDQLMDYDFGIEVTKSGKFSCSQCVSKRKKAYDTAEELIHEHLFEYFLRWSSRNISKNNYLVMLNSRGGSTSAHIIQRKELHKYFSKNRMFLIGIISLKEWEFPS